MLMVLLCVSLWVRLFATDLICGYEMDGLSASAKRNREKIFRGTSIPQECGYTNCITGEQSRNKLIALSRGALWKLQVDVDQKQ